MTLRNMLMAMMQTMSLPENENVVSDRCDDGERNCGGYARDSNDNNNDEDIASTYYITLLPPLLPSPESLHHTTTITTLP